ncbi:MAG: AAA family ATPase [Ignavibacteriaceae bacterium]|nr:AAA family ATPase [Ignavibacteriaceae bacterium]
MQLLPHGIQTYSEIKKKNMLYVDKTIYVKQLTDKYKYVFLSRPRRFGKSLFLSTVESFFEARAEDFENTAIESLTIQEKYPVIKLDFSRIIHDTPDKFIKSFKNNLIRIADTEGIRILSDVDEEYFSNLITGLYGKYKKQVVILIDEYDKPIVDLLDDPETAGKNRDILRNFFSTIKSLDEYLRFVFITGVSKFSKVSIFSGLNQIYDISLDENYSEICGYTESELEKYFGSHIDLISSKFGLKRDEALVRIKEWYNGYSWDGTKKVYNPFSILNLFEKLEFGNYWFITGTPAYLLKIIKEKKVFVPSLDNEVLRSIDFENYDVTSIGLNNLLLQTGYLTITHKESDVNGVFYRLSYPNYEVKEAFYTHLSAFLMERELEEVSSVGIKIRNSLEQGNIDEFRRILESILARIPSILYIEEEKYFHSIWIMIMYMSGIRVESEILTNTGRIDGVTETDSSVYILEFKYRKSAERALAQIEEKNYHARYASQSKKVILVGVSFDRSSIDIAATPLQQ